MLVAAMLSALAMPVLTLWADGTDVPSARAEWCDCRDDPSTSKPASIPPAVGVSTPFDEVGTHWKKLKAVSTSESSGTSTPGLKEAQATKVDASAESRTTV